MSLLSQYLTLVLPLLLPPQIPQPQQYSFFVSNASASSHIRALSRRGRRSISLALLLLLRQQRPQQPQQKYMVQCPYSTSSSGIYGAKFLIFLLLFGVHSPPSPRSIRFSLPPLPENSDRCPSSPST